jgi:acetyl-CoA carboxylase biotin carboxyl carrier protein
LSKADTRPNFYQTVNFPNGKFLSKLSSPAEKTGNRSMHLVLFSPAPVAYKRQKPTGQSWHLVAASPQTETGGRPKKRRINDSMSDRTSDADVAFIQALAELLNKNDLTELSVKREYGPDDRLDVKVSKQTQMVSVSVPAPGHAAPSVPASAPMTTPTAVTTEDPAQHPGAVTSPMVGTAYLSAEPGATPFVSIGATVTEGQTVLIIEAMKTMNQIPAPRAGTVKRILIADGNAVEYGAPLMIIE